MTDWLNVEEVRAACERERERLKAYGTVPKHYETMRRVLETIAVLPEPLHGHDEGCAEQIDFPCCSRHLYSCIWLVAREVVGG